jgi:hypothetical protein
MVNNEECYVKKSNMKTVGTITPEEMQQIKDSLMDDCYTLEEVNLMLSQATLTKTEKGVTVAYDNGAVDEFVFVVTTRLVHTNDL